MKRYLGVAFAVLAAAVALKPAPSPSQPVSRSGASPLATDTVKGLMVGDNSTITCTAGVCTATTGGMAGISQLTGDVTTPSGSGSQPATIAAAAVTLAKMANLAANSIMGNNTGSAAVPKALTVAQTKTLLAVVCADVTNAGTICTQNANNVAFTGGNINGTVIGGSVPAAGSFAALSASGAVTGTGFSTYLASPPAIGGTTPAAGAFTTISANSTVSGAGFAAYLASPPAIGGTLSAAGTFTNLTTSGTTTFSSITGSAQCLHVNTAGVLAGTGSDCGSGGGSGVDVSSASANIVVTPDGPGTTSFTVGSTAPINSQTGTTYTVLGDNSMTPDSGKIVTLSNSSPVAVTLGQAGATGFSSGYAPCLVNVNTGLVTITTTTSTINGSGQTIELPQGGSACIASNGANWVGQLSPIKIPGTANAIPYYASTKRIEPSTALSVSATAITSYKSAIATKGANCTLTAASGGGGCGADAPNGDCGQTIVSTGAFTATLPSTLPAGCPVQFIDGGGTVTVAAGMGATLNSSSSFSATTTKATSSVVFIVTTATGVAVFGGDGAT